MKFYDDDMDELFNKAGRDYPLKTDPKDWDAVRAALHTEGGAAEVTQKRTGWKRLLPLLFLLVIPAVYVFVDKDNIVGNSQQDVKRGVPAVTKDELVQTNLKSERTNKEMTTQKKILSNKKGDEKQLTSTEKQETATRQLNNAQPKKENQTPEISTSQKEQSTQKINLQIAKTKFDQNKIQSENSNRSRSYSINHSQEINQSQEIIQKENTAASEINNRPAFWNNIPLLNNTLSSLNGPTEAIQVTTPVRSLNQQNASTSVPNSDKQTKNKNRHGPYLGILAAPDLSTIKGQQVKGIGYSAGAIVGYTINNRWQVEGGMLWSRKRYYTDGKYFDKKGPGIPDYVNVLWLDGGCEMFEFPIVARYNFSTKKNTFFGSAGLTSYLMKKEDYDYSAIAGPGNYPYKGYRKYDRSGDHLFANLQITAGYNFSLSSKLNIRIEPYLKAPLKKIGIGKMPVTSTGLYFAITRDLR